VAQGSIRMLPATLALIRDGNHKRATCWALPASPPSWPPNAPPT
jgi:ADP-ribose pyrophosphatase YjhB (NUDIX family)